jgi:hippurate hydrolase
MLRLTTLALSTAWLACLWPFAVLHASENGELIDGWLGSRLDGLVDLYREFHRHPELSFAEKETGKRLGVQLRALGADVTLEVGGHGVVGVLANGPGVTLLLRTDLDALPVDEQTGLPYASQVRVANDAGVEVGVMHACGHDIHMTNLVGVARFLAAHRDRWSGTVVCIGQPAEERGAGAKAMLEDGLFERFPRPDFGLALHVDPALAAGKVGYRAGYALANVDSVDVVVRGRGGHGAYPHAAIDPIVQAARLVLDVQTIVSREIAPTDPAVITVGSIHGGTKHNIIADACRLQFTVRSYSQEVREHLLEGIRRKAFAGATSARAPEPTVEVSEGTPALYNDDALVARLVPVFENVLGAENVAAAEPQMGGEDFSRYGLAGVPIFMFRLGSVAAERLAGFAEEGSSPPSLHSPLYYPDARDTLETGVRAMAAAALEILAAAGGEE